MSDLIEQLKPLLAQLKHPVAEAAFLELAKSVQAKNDEIERLTFVEKNHLQGIAMLEARVAALEGVYKAAVNYEKFQSHAYAGLLFDAVKAANEQDKPPFYTGFPTMHPPATEQEGET